MEELDEAHIVRRGQSAPPSAPNEDLRDTATDRTTTGGGSPPRSRRRRKRKRRRRGGANKTPKTEVRDAATQATAATPMLSASLTSITEASTAFDGGREEEDVPGRRSRGPHDPRQRDHRQRPRPASAQPVLHRTGPSMTTEDSKRTFAFRNHSTQVRGPLEGSETEPPALLKGMDDFDSRWHSSASARRSRLLALMALVSFIFLVVLLLFVAVYSKNVKKRAQSLRHFCTEDVCHRATSYLSSFVNESIDACADFYQRVCYRWVSGEEAVGFVDGAMASYYEAVAKGVSTATRVDHIGSHVFRGVFKSCSRFVRSQHNVSESTAKVKERLRGRLFYTQTSWREAVVLILELALRRGIPTVLRVGWEKSSRRTTLLQLSLEKPLRDKLGSFDLGVYSRFVKELLPAEDLLDAVMKLDENVTRIGRGASDVEEVHPLMTVCRHLSSADLTPDLWTAALNIHLRPRGRELAANDDVLTVGLDGLVDVLTELMAVPPDAAFAYLDLLVFAEVLQYDYFRKRSNRNIDLIDICLRATQRVLTPTWPYVIALIWGHQHRVHYLQDLFGKIRAGTLEVVRSSTWMDATTHVVVKDTLANSTFYTFTEADVPPVTVDYKKAIVEGDDFVKDYLTALAYDAGLTIRWTPRTSQSALLSDLQLSGKVYFDESDSTLIVPSAYATKPLFYSTHGEQFHNFATVGVKMAAALLDFVSGTRSAVRLQSRRSLISLASATECYKNQFELAFVDSRLPDYLGNTVFMWTLSVRAAYVSLKKYCQRNLSPGEMQVYWKRIQQLFFERYCLLSCGAKEAVLTPLQTCVIPLQNMPEFAAVYDCPKGSRMNPVPKCKPL